MHPLPQALANLASLDLQTGAKALFSVLGYASDKTEALPSPDAAGFAQAFDHEFSKTALEGEWERVELLFQLTGDELSGQLSLAGDDFNAQRFESFLFFALDLKGEKYSRGALAGIARELNKPFPAPVIVLFRHGTTVSLASLHRRENKKDSNRDVLDRVVLLKDIRLHDTHRAHLDILSELGGAKTRARDWKGFLAEWNRVLDLSELNKKFYRDYKVVFDAVEAAAILPAELESSRRDWTQRFFNRLIFLRFLEKKGWMHFEDDDNYLRALFSASQKAGDDFLNDRLYFVFFWGLGLPGDVSIDRMAELEAVRGVVPFLNGGLFESFGRDDERGAVTFHNQDVVFASILGLFERYYFTVAENTPLEEEVGVDPEMLGKVFEELVTGRHESGSYYTPRGIVSFMGREALKGYLSACDDAAAIEKFVDDNDASELSDPEAVLRALREITICDPACGSGAYLLGMMSELLRLRETLFAAKAKDHPKIFKRKLEIIANNLYGVDKDSFAIQIAMLRLWLSLVVEFEGATPPPLPNLKYKIEVGDSLGAPLAGAQKTLDVTTVADFNLKKREYVAAHGDDKKRLESEIETVRRELKAWSDVPDGQQIHDWRIEFAEIFENGGFDIVLANPPYIRMELFKEQKPTLKKNFVQVHAERADLYIYFYARAHELLKDGGIIAFISPNKWFRAAYGAKLRAFFAQNARVETIVDFGDLQVFESATAYPMVFVAKKGAAKSATSFTLVKNLAAPYPDVRAVVKRDGALLPESALNGSNWSLSNAQAFSRLETMRKAGLPLGEYVKGHIFRGVVTGLNEAFVIDGKKRAELIQQDARSAERIKPLVAGRDIRRWSVDYKDKWLIYTHHGISTEGLEPILNHLKPFKEKLESRATQQAWYELQQPQAKFISYFEKPKILYQEIATYQSFAWDNSGTFINNKAFLIADADFYLLGVLNSLPAWEFLDSVCGKMVGGAFAMQTPAVFQLPIPTASPFDKSTIETLVAACLEKKGQNCQGEEAEINARVATLYGL